MPLLRAGRSTASIATLLLLSVLLTSFQGAWTNVSFQIAPNNRGKTALNYVGIYGSEVQARHCLDLAWSAALQRYANNRGAAANCLRMAFHDAGTYSNSTDAGGANGSILQELNFANFPQHNGLVVCPNIIQGIVQQLRNNGCPQITVADTIQAAGAAAVSFLSGPACPLLMGRPDAVVADITSALPSQCDTANTGASRFTTMGFTNPIKALTVLSGAHNVGQSRVTQRSQCSQGLGPLTADPGTFNGHYYTEVVQQTGRRGWFASDRNLNAPGAPTASLMQTYSANHGAFLADWCASYQEMSLLGVDPAPAGKTFLDGWAANVVPLPSPAAGPSPNGSPNNGAGPNGGPNNGPGPNNGGGPNGGPNNGAGPNNGGGPNVGGRGGGPNGGGPNGGGRGK